MIKGLRAKSHDLLATRAAVDRLPHHVPRRGGKTWVLSVCNPSLLSCTHSEASFSCLLPASSWPLSGPNPSSHRVICQEFGGGVGLSCPFYQSPPLLGCRRQSWHCCLGKRMPALAPTSPSTPSLPSTPPRPSPGGGLGNWFHLRLILNGAKGKVINIFIYNSRRIKF